MCYHRYVVVGGGVVLDIESMVGVLSGLDVDALCDDELGSLAVKFEVLENGSWIGAEWMVNLSNGWVGPVNEYAAWLMFDRSW